MPVIPFQDRWWFWPVLCSLITLISLLAFYALWAKKNLETIVQERTQDLQRSNDSLKQSRETYRDLVEHINEVIYSLDDQGVITYVSPAIESITGNPSAVYVGKNFLPFFHSDDQQKLVEEYEMILSGQSHVNESRILTNSGEYRWVSLSSRPIKESNRITGLRGVLADITEQKMLEQELLNARKLESVGILAGGIAHDFNNLLMVITGNISLAKTIAGSSEKVNEFLSEVESALDRAQKLTQQLLTFSKGGSPVKETANLIDLVRETASFSLRGSNVSCQFDFPDHLWLVDVDKGQFGQVIQNLIINADQAMPEGGIVNIKGENVHIADDDVKSAAGLRSGDYVILTIQDQGIGISDEYLQKIFDPYFTTKQKGSGLGLATTYSIIKNHDSTIAVQSQIGVGTTFTISIPASLNTTLATPKMEPEPISSGQGRILVMDDEKMIRTVVGRMLEKIGYEVDYAEDGNEAIEKYTNALQSGNFFKAVLMDLTIPGGMGGKEAVQILLEIDPQVKAVVSSGYSGDPIMANYEEYGFCGVISKPYRTGELRKTLQDVLQ